MHGLPADVQGQQVRGAPGKCRTGGASRRFGLSSALRRGSPARRTVRVGDDLPRLLQSPMRLLPELGDQPQDGGPRGLPQALGRDDGGASGNGMPQHQLRDADAHGPADPGGSAVRHRPRPLRPLVYNTGGYDRVETLGLLDGVFDIYMPDIKYTDPAHSKRYSGAADYPEVAKAAVREMHRQVGDLVLDPRGIAVRGLLVRHLVMPGESRVRAR